MEYQLAQRSRSKECQIEQRYMFTRLKSWQEKSQREFSNFINSQSTIMDKSLGNLVEEVDELQTQLSAVKKERDNLLETVANMGSEITKLHAKLPSPDALPDTEENPCQDAQETSCHRSQDHDVKEGSKISIDDNELEEHIDDAVDYPGMFLSSDGITDEAVVTDQTRKDRETVQLRNEGLPEKETTNADLDIHMESVYTMGGNKFKCKHCPYTSAGKSHMKDHIEARHERARLHSCKECGYMPPRKKGLNKHMKDVHGKVKMHVCEDCGYSVSRKTLLTSHRLYVHELKTKNLTVINTS